MVVIFSTVYLRYNDMFIWVGSGFLPLLGCVMKALLSTCLQDYRMMWIKNGFTFHVSWLNYVFWVFSTFVGGLFGNLLTTVDLRGIDFVLQGLFIVVFLEMLLNAKNNKIRAFGVAGAAMAVAMLLLVGKSLFMLLSMSCMLVVCYLAYKWGRCAP